MGKVQNSYHSIKTNNKQTKLAYVDSVAKPPRGVKRAQVQCHNSKESFFFFLKKNIYIEINTILFFFCRRKMELLFLLVRAWIKSKKPDCQKPVGWDQLAQVALEVAAPIHEIMRQRNLRWRHLWPKLSKWLAV